MWFTAKPSSTAPPSGRSVVALLRPLAWIGATLGVFPYRKMPPAPASPAVLARGSSSLFLVEEVDGGKPRPVEGAGLGPPSPPYRLVWCTLHTTVAALWVTILILGYVALGVPLVKSIWQHRIPTLRTLYWLIGGNTNLAYVVWWWVLVSRRRRLETHLASLEEHHRSYPTRGTRARLALALGLACSFFTLAVNIEATRRTSTFTDVPSLALRIAMVLHGMAMGNVMLSMVWVLLAHHTEQLEAANVRMSKALQATDLQALQASRKVLMEVRKLCLGTEDTFTIGLSGQLSVSTLSFCFGLASLSLTRITEFSELNIQLIFAFTLGAMLQVFSTFFLGHQCFKTAEATIFLLQGYGEGTDQFSREVSNIRRDLDTAPVIFTIAECLDLTLLGLWSILQHVLTQVVLIVQFVNYDMSKAQSQGSTEQCSYCLQTNDSSPLNTTTTESLSIDTYESITTTTP